tara:strand:- start:315 stop:488 length:174 start_codon:yes stop_codon:yes gene_type:complete
MEKKKTLSDEISEELKKFQEKGGVIQEIPIGASALRDKGVSNRVNRFKIGENFARFK